MVQGPSTLPASGRERRGVGLARSGGDTPSWRLAAACRRCWLRRVRSLGHPGLHLSPLVIDGDVSQLGWRPLDLGGAEAEVVEDPLDCELIVDVGHDLERTPAPATGERIGVVA